MSKHSKETYLGDGVFVAYDGLYIRLYTERAGSIHDIFLGDGELAALEKYVAEIRRKEGR